MQDFYANAIGKRECAKLICNFEMSKRRRPAVDARPGSQNPGAPRIAAKSRVMSRPFRPIPPTHPQAGWVEAAMQGELGRP